MTDNYLIKTKGFDLKIDVKDQKEGLCFGQIESLRPLYMTNNNNNKSKNEQTKNNNKL